MSTVTNLVTDAPYVSTAAQIQDLYDQAKWNIAHGCATPADYAVIQMVNEAER